MTSAVKMVSTNTAAKPLGHYSQAIIHEHTVYVAMQLGIVPDQENIVAGTIEEQTTQALKNVEAILIAAGSDISKILKVTVYITDIDLWGKVNAIYAEILANHKPARAVVSIKELHFGFQVAFDVIAAC